MRAPFFLAGPCLAALLATAPRARAQHENYWNQNYGARAALLGGAVVGGVRDNSAGFYNPGAMAFITNPSLSVSATGYQVDLLSMPEGAGPSAPVRSENLLLKPLLISGIKQFKQLPKLAIAYTVLTRAQTSLWATARATQFADLVATQPGGAWAGPEEYIGQVRLRNTNREVWGGATVSYRPQPRMGLGATLFVAYRGHIYAFEQTAQLVGAANPSLGTPLGIADARALTEVDYYTVRLIAKLGWAWQTGDWRLGAALTLPVVQVLGAGSVWRENVANGLPGQSGFLGSDRQTSEARFRWRSPFSLAVGAEWRREMTTLAASAELYLPISEYDIVAPEAREFRRPSTQPFPLGSEDFLRVRGGARAVFNLALAAEHPLTDELRLGVALRTNFSPNRGEERSLALLNGEGIDVSGFAFNMYHFSGGLTWTDPASRRSDISLGIDVGYASSRRNDQLANLQAPTGTTLFGPATRTDARLLSLAIVLGYTYYWRE